MKTIYLIPLFLLVLFSTSCSTTTVSKAIVITPKEGESKIAVTSKADAKCYDVIGILGIMWCDITLDLQQELGSNQTSIMYQNQSSNK